MPPCWQQIDMSVDIKVKIFWAVFVFTWVLVVPESFFFNTYLWFGSYYKELKSFLRKSEQHHPARGSMRMEGHAAQLFGGISLGLLGRNAERHFAGWGAVPPGGTSQLAVTCHHLTTSGLLTAEEQVPISSWSRLTLPVLATAVPWKQEDSPTWSLARPREEVVTAM